MAHLTHLAHPAKPALGVDKKSKMVGKSASCALWSGQPYSYKQL